MYLYDEFVSARFSLIFDGDNKILTPRKALSAFDIDFHNKTNNLNLEPWEINVIFSLDATYNRATKWNQN